MTDKLSRWQGKIQPLVNGFGSITKRFVRLYHLNTLREKGLLWSMILLSATSVVVVFFLGVYWSQEPSTIDVKLVAARATQGDDSRMVPGFTTTVSLIELASTLLDKPGGYLSNDKLPPASLFGLVTLLDNIPNWEFGALVMIRDTSRILRNDFSRSQTQSVENKHLALAEPQFNFPSDSWLFPPAESEYRAGISHLTNYLESLYEQSNANAQFFTRADNLNELLAVVEKRLGSLSQRLNASVEELRVNIDLAGDTAAEQSTPTTGVIISKTPWLKIDDVFYEARGYVWALLGILHAVEIDFNKVLQKKNAVASMQQVIRLLELALVSLSSPMILNGSPMGWMANYSKTMVSYISPANAAIIDLRNLLSQG